MDKDENVLETRRRAQLVVKQLREHQQEVEDDKAEAVDCRSEALSKHFKKAEHNLGMSRTVDQALIDAQIFHKLGVYSKKQADQLQTGLKTYDVKTFDDCLVVHMSRACDAAGEEVDENASIDLGGLAKGGLMTRWGRINALPWLYGNEPKDESGNTHKERKRPEKIRKNTVATKPNEVKSGDVEQTETDRQIAEMKRVLKSQPSWNYWVFVLDPHPETGFTRSIENIFHSSFLIKENIAFLDMKKSPATISYLDPNRRQSGEDGSGTGETRSAQLIMGFDRNTWLEKIRENNVTRCLLPSRPRVQLTQTRTQRRLSTSDEEEDETAGF